MFVTIAQRSLIFYIWERVFRMSSGYVAKIKIANDDVTFIDDLNLTSISFKKEGEVIQKVKPFQVTVPLKISLFNFLKLKSVLKNTNIFVEFIFYIWERMQRAFR